MSFKSQLVSECGRTARIGLPIVIAQLLNISMGFVDTIMTGNYSAEALAAVSSCQNMVTPLIMFTAAVISAGQAITAQYTGAGKPGPIIGRVTINSLAIGIVFALAMMIYSQFAPALLPFFGFERPVIELAEGYLFAFAWGIPGTIIFIVFTGFYAGIARPSITMLVSFVMLSVNIVGNYGFIYGRFGLPELGAVGAGWTSSAAAWSGTITILALTALRRESRSFFSLSLSFRLYRSLIRQIMKIGTPSGFSIVFESTMFAVFSLLMGRFGVVVLSGSQIALNCASITFMIPLGLSFAITTNVGIYIGQDRYGQARLAGIAGYTVSIICSLISATGLFLFNHKVSAIYTQDTRVMAIAASLLIFAAIFQLSDALQVAGMGILRGYKDTRIPMIANLISYWGVGMTLGVALGFGMDLGATGMWIGIIIGLTVAALLHGLRFRLISKRWILREENRDRKTPAAVP